MSNDRPAQSSFDFRLFFIYHVTMMALMVGGGLGFLTIPLELLVASFLAVTLVVASIRHRRQTTWQWPGARGSDWLGVGAIVAFAGAMIFATRPAFPFNAASTPWYLAVLGIASYNILSVLHLIPAEPADAGKGDEESREASAGLSGGQHNVIGTIRLVASELLIAYGFVSFWCFLWLESTWRTEAPSAPNAVLGLIYATNNHGSIRYFSAFQATACAVMFFTSIPLCLLGAWIQPKINVTRKFLSAKWEVDDPLTLRGKLLVAGTAATPVIVFLVGPYIIRALNAAGIIFNLG